jgi:acetyltransferase
MTGGKLAPLAPTTIEQLNAVLPPHWSHGNPIDILGDATPERYQKALDIALKDPYSDGLLVILTPQAMTNPSATAQQLQNLATASPKPILASWMGGEGITTGELMLNAAQIPTYRYPDSAARLFNLMWKYNYNLQALYETPTLPPDEDGIPNRELAHSILEQVSQQGRTILTEVESKQILAAYGIPVVPTAIATNPAQAVELAESFGYPVVLKLLSQTVTHKTDVGGVQLNLTDAEAIHWAYMEIEGSVSEKVGKEHFQGVTVQPMLKPDGGYELTEMSKEVPTYKF